MSRKIAAYPQPTNKYEEYVILDHFIQHLTFIHKSAQMCV